MVIIMGIIFFLSHQSGDQLDVPDLPFIDKIAHFSIYAVLAGTILLIPSEKFKRTHPFLTILITVSICLLHGLFDEFHQSFIPGRFVSGADVLADVLGAMFISIIWFRKIRARNIKLF